ncbi:MAG: hypothetical protein ACREU3_04410 [Steroidobacteraceae bacterium]
MGKSRRRKREQRVARQGTLARAQASHGFLRELPRARSYKGPKSSAVLFELIEPYVGKATSLEAYRQLAILGVMSWNWAVDPKLLSRRQIEGLPRECPGKLRLA